MYKCKYCNRSFDTSRSLGGHVSTHHGNCDERSKKGSITRTLKRFKEMHICEKCGKSFEIEMYINNKGEKVSSDKNKSGRFCTRKCANSKPQTEESNKKRSKTLIERFEKISKINRISRNKKSTCKICGSFDNIDKHKRICNICRYEYYHCYVVECKFVFSLKDYSDLIDLSLLKEFGMYAPINRGNNLNGVSRDHIYSSKQGFINKISPVIVRHPANCRIIKHRENQHKRDKSYISLKELCNRIEYFESVHPSINNVLVLKLVNKLKEDLSKDIAA